MQFDELKKICQNWFYAKNFVRQSNLQTFTSFTHFETLLESKIFVGKQNPWNSLTILTLLTNRSNSRSNTLSLDLQSSIAQMKLEGSKMRVYIGSFQPSLPPSKTSSSRRRGRQEEKLYTKLLRYFYKIDQKFHRDRLGRWC